MSVGQLQIWGDEIGQHVSHVSQVADATRVLVEKYQALSDQANKDGRTGDAERLDEIRNALDAAADQIEDAMTNLNKAITDNEEAISHMAA